MLHYRSGAYAEALGLIEEVQELENLDHALAHLGALSAFRLGNVDLAKTFILRAVALSPEDASSWNVLGEIHRLSKDLLKAVEAFQKALAINANFTDALSNLGNVYSDAGDFDNAVAAYSQALTIDPSHIDARYNLGNLAFTFNRHTLALDSYQQVLARVPDHTGALNNYGLLLMALRQYPEAEEVYKKLMAIQPYAPPVVLNYANVLAKSGRTAECLSVLNDCISKLSPSESVPLLLMKARTLREGGEKGEVKRVLEGVLTIEPHHEEATSELINVDIELGNSSSARARLAQLLEASPTNLNYIFARCFLELPAAYRSEKEILEIRQRYESLLVHLKRVLDELPDDSILGIENLIGTTQPFFLAYQAMNNRMLQTIYGEMIATAMQRAMKLPPPAPTKPIVGRPVKVGIVSGFFRDHSNYKIPIRGWLRNLDRKKFQIIGYHTQTRLDAATREAESLCHSFIQGPKTLAEWVALIRSHEPDILIYPEIGMDPMTCRLASLRLAPVQATSWGHPETSGLPTIDYFLSSELMEPPGADAFYSERVVRLPRLSFSYDPPIRRKLTTSRKDVGLRDDAVVYWCCQTNYKYLPQYDWIFPAIAREVPTAQFVFIQTQPESEASAILRERLEKAFQDKGLVSSTFVVYLHGLDPDTFATIASLCDLALDSFDWSGCNSTLETLAQGVPILTCPGTFMRSRHTSAILSTIDCSQLIVSSPEEFVQRAISLARSRVTLHEIRTKVMANLSRAYRDPDCIKGLEDTLMTWVSDAAGC
ncbi:MAG: hypothetical protein RL518_1559 [Pseudomonadota bacterium]